MPARLLVPIGREWVRLGLVKRVESAGDVDSLRVGTVGILEVVVAVVVVVALERIVGFVVIEVVVVVVAVAVVVTGARLELLLVLGITVLLAVGATDLTVLVGSAELVELNVWTVGGGAGLNLDEKSAGMKPSLSS